MKREEIQIGNRVQVSPATDAWMRGDRYGEVTGVGKKYVHIKMDRSGRTLKFSPELIYEVLASNPRKRRVKKFTRQESAQLFDKLARMSESQAEAYLNTPEGEAARQAFNIKMMKRNPCKGGKRAVRRRVVHRKRRKSGVVRKRAETLKSNPRKYIIEALVRYAPNATPDYKYYEDAKERFVSQRDLATQFGNEKLAFAHAKAMRNRLPSSVISLRIVPA